MNNQCINCRGTPLFLLSFSDERLNRFCKDCILLFANESEMCGIDVIECCHCYDFDYEYRFKRCKECNLNFCIDCRNYHIYLHYIECNKKFKQDLSPIIEELISKDVVQNILMDYIEL